MKRPPFRILQMAFICTIPRNHRDVGQLVKLGSIVRRDSCSVEDGETQPGEQVAYCKVYFQVISYRCRLQNSEKTPAGAGIGGLTLARTVYYDHASSLLAERSSRPLIFKERHVHIGGRRAKPIVVGRTIGSRLCRGRHQPQDSKKF